MTLGLRYGPERFPWKPLLLRFRHGCRDSTVYFSCTENLMLRWSIPGAQPRLTRGPAGNVSAECWPSSFDCSSFIRHGLPPVILEELLTVYSTNSRQKTTALTWSHYEPSRAQSHGYEGNLMGCGWIVNLATHRRIHAVHPFTLWCGLPTHGWVLCRGPRSNGYGENDRYRDSSTRLTNGETIASTLVALNSAQRSSSH